MTKALDFLALSDTTKMKVSIYSGCDYVDNIRGLGFGTLINYTDTEQELDDFIDVILKKGSSILPDGMDNVEEYKIQCKLTFAGFNNQLVFDEDECVYLSDFSSKQNKEFNKIWDQVALYIGETTHFQDKNVNKQY